MASIRAAIYASVILSAGLVPHLGLAQAAPAGEADQSQPLELSTVTVTATRVVRQNFTAPTPTVVLDSDDIAKTGATNVGEIAAQVPAFEATGTPTTSTLSTDTGRGNFLNLRGLGPSRTLVLVDGQRFVPTTPDGLLDTDVIPAAMIDHVEVVTGGASASWGSDAVAGVVNVILKKDLNGVAADFSAGESGHDDNRQYRASLAFGSDFASGLGHFEIAAEDVKNEGVLRQSDRDWSARNWGLVQIPPYSNVPVTDARLSIASYGGLILSGALAGMQFGPGGTLEPFQFGSNVGNLYMQGGDGAAFAPYVALEVPQQRDNVFMRTSYHITSGTTAFIDVSYSQADTSNPNLVSNFDLVDTLSPDNAFLSASARAQMLADGETSFLLGRIDNDFGFIRSDDRNRVWRTVAGLSGKLPGTWTWDAYYEYGNVNHPNDTSNVIRTDRYALSLDSVIDPATNQPVCRSTLTDPGNGCMPIDIFGVGSPSPAAIAYVTGTEQTLTRYEQNVLSASAQGEPFSTWAGPASVALGTDYREENEKSTVDAAQEAGLFLIGDAKSFQGRFHVEEGYLETVLPMLPSSKLGKSFDVDLAARFTDYSTSGSVTTWKAGAIYALNDEIKLRATRSRDIRAPNLSELYQTGSLNFANVTDPTTGANDFVANPLPANPKLQPEKGDTLTIGAIYQPEWLRALTLSVDYYDIKVNQVIAQLNPQDVVNRCAGGNIAQCAYVHRDGSGTITEVDTPNINLASFRTKGLDFETFYGLPLANLNRHLPGSLSFHLLATYVNTFAASDGVRTADEAGAVGAINLPANTENEGLPHWRGNLGVTYALGRMTLFTEGRYVGGGKLDNLYGPTDVPDNHVPSRFYLDMSAAYTVLAKGDYIVQVYAHVDNVLDQDPPIIVSNFIAPLATNPSLYDVIGRTFTLGIRLQQ
jgi:iron complex outermembrane recepter protein